MTELLICNTFGDFVDFSSFFAQKLPFLRVTHIQKFQMAIWYISFKNHMKQNNFIHRIRIRMPEPCGQSFCIKSMVLKFLYWDILPYFLHFLDILTSRELWTIFYFMQCADQ